MTARPQGQVLALCFVSSACPFLRIETLSVAYISGSELVVFALARWTSALLFSHEFYQRHRSFVVDPASEFFLFRFFIHCRPLLISASAGGREVNRSLLVLGNDLLQIVAVG